jgi:hypothetical protein
LTNLDLRNGLSIKFGVVCVVSRVLRKQQNVYTNISFSGRTSPPATASASLSPAAAPPAGATLPPAGS